MAFKIYTKTGDGGETSLFGGEKVKKYHQRVESYGAVDELNSHIGLLIAQTQEVNLINSLQKIQRTLFNVGSLLATPQSSDFYQKLETITENEINFLETEIDWMEEPLPELTQFILPGGSVRTAQTHICRTVCRRAERNIVLLNENEKIEKSIIIFMNRCSDYFFVLSRYIGHLENKTDVFWKP